MFRVLTRGFSAEYERWTDALETANSLKPKCRSWLQDVRIYDGEDLVWVYSRSHTYPQYIGAGTYNRLAQLFVQEAIAESTTSVHTDEPNHFQADQAKGMQAADADADTPLEDA